MKNISFQIINALKNLLCSYLRPCFVKLLLLGFVKAFANDTLCIEMYNVHIHVSNGKYILREGK